MDDNGPIERDRPWDGMIEDLPDPRDVEYLREQINNFNFDTTGIRDGREIAIFHRDNTRAIVAGIYGWSWGGCAEVDQLWVAESLRQAGVGSALLDAFEREARQRGCARIVVSTHEFQAPDFYKSHGYEVFGAVDDYPRGHQHIYLLKQLGPD